MYGAREGRDVVPPFELMFGITPRWYRDGVPVIEREEERTHHLDARLIEVARA